MKTKRKHCVTCGSLFPPTAYKNRKFCEACNKKKKTAYLKEWRLLHQPYTEAIREAKRNNAELL